MARELPDPAKNYETHEVQAMFGFLGPEAVMDAVKRRDLPKPIRMTRESVPLWSGKVLADWMEMLPHLETAPPPAPQKNLKKPPGEPEGTEG